MSLQISVKPYRALEIIQEEAKKNRSSRISWAHVTKNKKYALLISQNNLYANHQDHLKKLKQAFRKAVKQIQRKIKDKNGVIVDQYLYDAQRDQFVRRNEFEDIKSQQTLLRQVQKSPKGLLISDQLLQYTYKQVQNDIEKLLKQKKIKKINSSNKTKKDYYIFSNTIQQHYGLSDTYEHFGKDEYLEFCRKNYKTFDSMNDKDYVAANSSLSSYNSQRFNEWVPGYAQMKKQWLLRNQEKLSLKPRT